MSHAASQAATFYRDIAQRGKVWTVRDERGFPAPMTPDGKRAMPFWSTASRVRRIVDSVPAFSGFAPVELTWAEFRDRWLPDLEHHGLNVGVNWSGPKAVGYDIAPEDVRRAVEVAIQQLSAPEPGR